MPWENVDFIRKKKVYIDNPTKSETESQKKALGDLKQSFDKISI